MITQTGETKAVLQDIASLEETQAALKILARGNQDVEAGAQARLMSVDHLRIEHTPGIPRPDAEKAGRSSST